MPAASNCWMKLTGSLSWREDAEQYFSESHKMALGWPAACPQHVNPSRFANDSEVFADGFTLVTTPFTIWRGGHLLGTIVIPFRGDPSRGVAGILKTDSDLDGIAPIIQSSLDYLPGAPVIQSPPSRSRVAVLRELSALELEGVPAELRLEVQDDQGQPVPVKMITIDHFDLPSSGEGDLAEACRTNGFHGRGWVASALFADSNVSDES